MKQHSNHCDAQSLLIRNLPTATVRAGPAPLILSNNKRPNGTAVPEAPAVAMAVNKSREDQRHKGDC